MEGPVWPPLSIVFFQAVPQIIGRFHESLRGTSPPIDFLATNEFAIKESKVYSRDRVCVMPGRAVIAGGGLAGLTCAKTLVDAGWSVSIFEGLPFLGGRASTYRDQDGDWIEQGLHLFLGTYSQFKQLLREIDRPPDDVLFWKSQVRLQDPQGTEAVYGSNPFTAPVKTFLSLLGQNSYLGPFDKLSLVPLSLPGLAGLKRLESQFDHQTVKEWWARAGGTDDVLEKFLRPFCRAIQFTDVEEYSAYNFLGWLHHVIYDLPHAFLGGYQSARDELIFAPLGRYLTDRGATIQTNTKLNEIGYDKHDRKIDAFLMEDGTRLQADVFVVALPAWNFAPLIPRELQGEPFFEAIVSLPTAPAISVQIWFDRQVVQSDDFILVARSEVPVYQDQATCTYPYAAGSRISATISPAGPHLKKTEAELVQMTLDSLSSVSPEIREARVTKSVVLKHEQHLIRPLPGAMSSRPSQATPISNLFLAGDWTLQEYFGSQEGAVRSGRYCAAAIRERHE